MTLLHRLIVTFLLVLCSKPFFAQTIAITFDDLPAHGPLPPGITREQVAAQIIQALQTAGVSQVYGFVNGIRIEQNAKDAAVLDEWRNAGFPLGNHTWSHMNLDEHSLEEFEQDLTKNEPVMQERMQGEDWRWLRFPFLAEGNNSQKQAGIRQFLALHHYRVAQVTMSFGDYLFNEPFARCAAKGDQAAISRLSSAYLKAAAEDASYRRALAHSLFGHDVPYVLLMHIGAFDAYMLPQLLRQYKDEGFHFVSLAEAESDPFYAIDRNLDLPPAPDTLEGLLALDKIPPPANPPILESFEQMCR